MIIIMLIALTVQCVVHEGYLESVGMARHVGGGICFQNKLSKN